MAGKFGILGHEDSWLLRGHDKNVEWQSAGGVFGEEPAFGASEIESAERLMEVESPTRGADEPGNRHASAMRTELVAALAAAHRVFRPATIKLRAALAKT